MAEFLIAAPERIAWSLSVEAFAEAVNQRWPEAGVRGWGEGAHLAASAWVRREDAWGDILIELHPNRNIIGIDVRSSETAAEIACWWRRLVPPDVQVLWLFGRSFVGYTEIWPDTVPSEIFGQAPTD
jgi:hypothetical protein